MKGHTLICLDESGGLRTEAPFLVGAFFATNQSLIKSIINYARNLHNYPYELHFNKISNKDDDKRFKTSKTLFQALLLRSRDWQARIIYSNDPKETGAWRGLTIDELYNKLVKRLILSCGNLFLRGRSATFILDEKNKAKWNDFIPVKLEELLNNKIKKATGTNFIVKTGKSSQNDFIQIADLFLGAVRQLYVPSTNKNKIELANLIKPVLIKKNSQIKLFNAC